MIFVLLLHAQWGLAQFVTQDDLGLYLIGETRLDAAKSGIAKFTLDQNKMIRAYGPFPHPNSFGGGLSLGLLAYATWLFGMKKKTLLRDGIANIVLVFLLLGIIVSFSRSTYLSAGFTMLIFFALTIKRMNWHWLILLMTMVLVFSPLLIARVNDVEDAAVSERLVGARWALALIDWRGIGVGEYKVALQKYLDAHGVHYEPWQIDYVHNVPILIAVESGLAVIMLLAGGLLLLLKMFYADRWWWLLPLLPLILFDHYMVTQLAPMASMLVWLVLLRAMPTRVVH
ncbi:MAG: O-antigen ligase family protein [bacterium]